MNNLLPSINELKPYLDKNGTFYDCGFNQDFNELDFQKKLQVINDIVRQSMIVDDIPNPLSDVEELVGDCFTAASVSMQYMKSLGVGQNHRLVICLQRMYDPSDITSRHVALLVDDEENNTYFYDATPYVGFMYGRVEKINSNNNGYKNYETIDEAKYELIYKMREFTYKISRDRFSDSNLMAFIEVLEESKKHPCLNNMTARCYMLISKYLENESDKQIFIKEAHKLNPYKNKETENIEKLVYRKELILKQISKWQEELRDLRASNTNLKRQLELAQNIYQETKLMDQNYENWVNIDCSPMRIANLTPRFMQEHGLNIVMLKPSAEFINAATEIKERFTANNKAIYEYDVNLALPRKLTGILPIVFTHPMGETNIRAYTGNSKIMLLKAPATELYKLKKQVRSEFGKDLNYKTVKWSDDRDIFWHPALLNYVHSSDTPCEASLNLNNGYPEQQIMTRFMYPNPKFKKEENE